MTILLLILLLAAPDTTDRPCVIIVEGAAGEPEYAGQFRKWADQWKAATDQAGAESIRIGRDEPSSGTTDRDRLRKALAEKEATGREPLWLVLIGHGTYDGREAKYNLRGPDVTDADLGEWLTANKSRPVAV